MLCRSHARLDVRNVARLILSLICLVVLVACRPEQAADGSRGATTSAVRRIAVIPKSTSHVFWTSVEAGAKKAGEELGVEIIWKGPIKESDRAGQIQLVQQLAANNVDGIVLAPLDSRALVGPVQRYGPGLRYGRVDNHCYLG